MLRSALKSSNASLSSARSAVSKALEKDFVALGAVEQKCRTFSSNSKLVSLPPIRSYSIPKYDMLVVGSGIVGMATAQELISRHPGLKYIVVDKENEIAAHQSGHNSGVIHAGIYYTPGSLKARLCVEGLRLSYKYFDENNVPYKKCGKLIVATSPVEVERLNVLIERGIKNEVPDLKVVGPDEIKDIEPNCVGLKAIHSPHTGIVDWGYVTRVYAKNFEKKGGHLRLNFKVIEFKESEFPEHPVLVRGTGSGAKGQGDLIAAKHVVACGGLYADILAQKSGCSPVPKIVPFRGEYLLLKPGKRDLVRGNIYPVPDPKFPFLGVHFTPRINGDVWLGPNAVLAFRREGYKLYHFSPSEFADALLFPGLRRLIFSNMSYALGELYRGVNISAQVKALQRFVPSLRTGDVERGPSGVRAQALDTAGKLVDDFVFDSGTDSIGKRMLHVRNAPSPAATSSLAIAKIVADRAKETFGL